MAVKEDRKLFNIDKIPIRTNTTYDRQSNFVEQDPSVSSLYGIKGTCPFNDLKYFHAIQGFPPDIYHDLLEGVCIDILESLFRQLVQEKKVSKSELQSLIERFPYDKADKVDRPSDINILSDFRPKCNAMQMFCLVRLLPFIIGNIVPIGHKEWQLFLCLRRLLDILFSFEIVGTDIATVKKETSLLAKKYIESVNDMLKSKTHNILHYATDIANYGPLLHCGTIRFEAKHVFFKEITNRTKNRINITKTLAISHQESNNYARRKL
jgi:hypothetical protein